MVLFGNYTYAQFGIESSYSVIHTGRNQSVDLTYKRNKITFNAGVKYSFNRLDRFPPNTYFRKTFFALSTAEHFGANMGVQYLFYEKEKLKVFAHYNLQILKAHFRFEHYSVLDSTFSFVPNPKTLEDYPLNYKLSFLGPVTALENTIGVGINLELTPRIYLTQKVGIGISLFYSKDPELVEVLKKSRINLGELYSIGLGFNF